MENESEGHSKCDRLFIQEFFQCLHFYSDALHPQWIKECCIACCGVCESSETWENIHTYSRMHCIRNGWEIAASRAVECVRVWETWENIHTYSLIYCVSSITCCGVYEIMRVVWHMNASCYIWMSHVIYEWVVSHVNESRHMWMGHLTCHWVMSHMNGSFHTWMSHVTYEGVMSHMNESCHIWISHVIYEWVVSHVNESRHILIGHFAYMNVIPYTWGGFDQ